MLELKYWVAGLVHNETVTVPEDGTPYFKKDADKWEDGQRRATRTVRGLETKSFKEDAHKRGQVEKKATIMIQGLEIKPETTTLQI